MTVSRQDMQDVRYDFSSAPLLFSVELINKGEKITKQQRQGGNQFPNEILKRDEELMKQVDKVPDLKNWKGI